MAKLKKYTGSDEQIEEMQKPGNTFCTKNVNNKFSWPFVWMDTKNHSDPRLRSLSDLKKDLQAGNVTHYLICAPHPYADLIKIWADTGCEVYIREHHNNYYDGVLESMDYHDLPPTGKPNWSIPGTDQRQYITFCKCCGKIK